ncbi:MAG: hypothetical protein PVJ67_00485 [Candidatus Pacearchaeota archaeon]|jgi:hypothetical protein
MSSTEKVKAALIIEVIGKPPEHLTETLGNLIKQISEEKGVEVVEKTIHEPTELKDNKDFFTSFAEVEVEVEEVLYIAMLMFKYMPAHIEIIHPEKIILSNSGLNDILNELTRRLHGYDEVARIIQVEKNILEKKLKELMPKEENKKE